MGFALDLGELMQRAGLSAPASRDPAPPASPANRLVPAPGVSHLATLAGVAAPVDAMPEQASCDPRPDLAAVAWTDGDIARFLDRRARLVRWGWPATEALALAERLRQRDLHADYRHLCVECMHYRPGRCHNHRRADLTKPDIGRELATLLQVCAGFAEDGRRR